MSSGRATIRARLRDRGIPSLAQAVSATGGVAIALGVLLISIDIRADNSGRAAETALFAGLVLAGVLVLVLLPDGLHPAGVSAIVLGIPGALGWLLLPGAQKFADIRPFLILTIGGWIVAFAIPRTGGRPIFIAAAAVLLWLWVLGEVVGTGAYSASPIPSPPEHTMFSLSAFAGARATVVLGDLDQTDPLYPLAESCGNGDFAACDDLYNQAVSGSGFQQFAATCGNAQPNTRRAGFCNDFGSSPLQPAQPFPTFQTPTFNPTGPIAPFTTTTGDKSFDIGIVSALFGVIYLGAVFVLDRVRWRGLATAFVVPGFLALVTGTQSLGNAAHHAWVGGGLTLVAGLFIGVVGDRTGRRFTTWVGGVTVALGALVIALDTAHISRSVNGGNVKLAGPGLIVLGFGAGLVALGLVIAHLLRHPTNLPPEVSPLPPPPPDPAPSWPTLH
ncbi:MAG TPA: hypothetical protein VGP92_15215 [Acidimicrobiia bacterium]|nr:hypothetical protein [Acidimicrobiia bacterium]